MSHCEEGYWKGDTLVIARISFRCPRQGHGTRLLQFLVEQADELGFKQIAIETPSPEEQAFGREFGMLSYK